MTVDHLLPQSLCPCCGFAPDHATSVMNNGAKPEVGDYSICLNCGALLRFGANLILEKSRGVPRDFTPEQRRMVRLEQARIRNLGPLPSMVKDKPN